MINKITAYALPHLNMKEAFYYRRRKIAVQLSEAQSWVQDEEGIVEYEYRVDEKRIVLPLTAHFLRLPYSQVRRYLDHCIRNFLKI